MKKICLLMSLVLLLSGVLLCFTSCGGTGNVRVIDISLSDEEYAFVVNKGDDALRADVNRLLSEMRQNGKMDEIINNYFGDGTPKKIKSAGRDTSKPQLVVATATGFPPFEMYDVTDDTYSGVDMEIAYYIAESLGRELVIQDQLFESVVQSVESGLCHIGMAALTVTPAREEIVTFTNSYYNASQVLVVRSGDKTFDDCTTRAEVEAILQALPASTKIGCQKGTTGETYIVGDDHLSGGYGFPGLSVEKMSYDYVTTAITDVINGNIDYVIADNGPAEIIVETINDRDFFDKIAVFADLFFTNGGWRRVVLVGLRNTLLIAVLGLMIGIVIGTLIAVVRVIPKYKVFPRILNGICSVYVGFFRGTPIVVQLLIAYYVMFPLMGIRISSLATCIIIFGMNSGAYVSEIMRGGIGSVDRGQLEAGRALGLPYWTTMLRIVIPQAVKNILPTLGNEFIALVKDTSVVSFVAAVDLYKTFTEIGNMKYEYLVPYLAMAIFYIVMVMLISLGVKLLERRLKRNERKA